ncbi:hypothetical protein [Streptomyces sp. SID12488]|uniref:hypothetical protein n=1 Tax=Streptomyces sp. SID12488 TaxID=2706040 RepID=UPI0013DC5EDD|nr:hypothetical protein [Streptomyces sp. SID12488]NEA68675.1 hypothetical protein [Streptomyces sp. SID12488]
MNEVLPQLNELLFSSVEGVLVESVEVTDTDVRVEARATAGRAACPGCGCRQAAPFFEHLVCGVVAGQASLLG